MSPWKRVPRKLHSWWTSPGSRGWRRVALVLPFMVLIMVAVGYTNHVQRQGDERWCDLIVLLDESADSTTPTTPEQIRFVQIIDQLRRDFRC